MYKLKSACCVIFVLLLGLSMRVWAAEAGEMNTVERYDPTQLAEKLIQIAEGPVPSRVVIEKDFGFEFSKIKSSINSRYYFGYISTLPFKWNGDYLNPNVTWWEDEDQIFLTFYFPQNNWKTPLKGCVLMSDMERLLGKNWTRVVKRKGYGHVSDYVVYKYNFSGAEIATSPRMPTNENCLVSIYINLKNGNN